MKQNINKNGTREKKKIDWVITMVPLAIIIALSVLFFFLPEQSNTVLGKIRFFFGDTLGTYYLIIGLGVFIISLFIAFSKYGNIVLGEPDEKPKYSFFSWGCMMFTCGLAADILFYSFSEWVMYANNQHIAEMGSMQDWASVYPIFHWSLIPWGFYLVLAVAFGFMLHVRKRNRQRFSEACRPILGRQTEKAGGRAIDLLAVFALLAGTATTFSVATPLMASVINELFHVSLNRTAVTIVILLITCFVYTFSLLHGFKGISVLAKICIYLFFGMMAFVLLFGGEAQYIIDTGISAIGRMLQNFVELSTYTDPQRTTSFPQTWTIYYWAYYRKHIQGKNYQTDNPWRILLWRGLHNFELYSVWQLWSGTSGIRQGRFYGTVCSRWRFVFTYYFYNKDIALCTIGSGCPVDYNDSFLCYFF